MKNATLLLILLATFCRKTEIYSQNIPSYGNIEFSKQDIPLKEDDTDFEGGIARTPVLQSFATAFLLRKNVYVDFNYPINEVTVSIINKNMEKCTHSITYCQPNTIIIDISMEENGEYQIRLDSSSFSLSGEFRID